MAIKGVRVTRSELDVILDALDANGEHSHDELRQHRRVAFRAQNVLMLRGESEEALTIATRNLSQGGVAFLFGQYMHVGERIRVALVDPQKGEWSYKGAKVVRCHHIAKMLHEIGAEFDTRLPVDPAGSPAPCVCSGKHCPWGTCRRAPEPESITFSDEGPSESADTADAMCDAASAQKQGAPTPVPSE